MGNLDVSLPALTYEWVKSQPNKVINHISPSALGGCERAHYFAIKHVQQTTPPNPGALINFELGKMWETPIEKALEQSGVEYVSQMEMYDEELNVKGTLDFALIDGNEWEVIDSKTESILAEKYRKFQKQTFLEASDRYVIQLGTYMLMLKRQGKDVKRGRFLLITKDNGMMTEHFVPYTQELEDRILARIESLNKHLKDGTIPDCECEGWKVGYCGYGDVETQEKSKTGKVVNTACCNINLLKGDK